MKSYENLTERKKTILFGAVEDFIKDATPITSNAIQKKHIQNISTATLRNELSALEAMGYLKQLHTSGGRTPTTKAYRLYVNEMMKKAEFNKKTLNTVNHLIFKRTDSLNQIVSSIAHVVSEVTNYPSIVILNGFDKLIIKEIKIIPLIDGNGLVLITTDTGIINNNIKLGESITEENVIDASKYLTDKFRNKSIGDMILNINQYLTSFEEEILQFKDLLSNLMNCLSEFNEQSQSIYQKGTTKLLNSPDYKNIDEARKVINFIEDNENIKEIFLSEDSEDITFSIGGENDQEELENCSVIKANCKLNGKNIASIGIIGPERMDYRKIAASLKLIIDEINTVNLLENNKEKVND